jgi:hypothetical protein
LIFHFALRAAALLFGAVFLLFPDISGLARELRAVRNPQSMVLPDDPAVAALAAEIERDMPEALPRNQEQRWIEAWVNRRFPYAHDWDTWWNVDYWPTPSETVAKGCEDCDGLAILVASLLRRRGHPARLEASIQHVWVEVEGQRLNDPGAETNYDEAGGWNMPSVRALLSWLRYGLSEFPYWRWALLALWLVFVIRWPSKGRIVPETLAMLVALAACVIAAKRFPGVLFAAVLLVCGAWLAWTLLRRVRPAEEPPGTLPDEAQSE